MDGIVPARTVRCYPNNKPWVTKEIKAIINRKKRAFRVGNREELRDIQRELKSKIKEAKDSYRRKLEWKLTPLLVPLQPSLPSLWTLILPLLNLHCLHCFM